MRAERAAAVVMVAAHLGACAMPPPLPGPSPDPGPVAEVSELASAVALMDRAQNARGEDWLRLHKVVASAAVMNPRPVLRARVALALSTGERSLEERERALALMDQVLATQAAETGAGPNAPLTPEFRQFVSVQRRNLLDRLEAERALSTLERALDHSRAATAHAEAESVKARDERNALESELSAARRQLRAVTRIELRHESSGG